eukprot:scpid96825/ scgid26145/ 
MATSIICKPQEEDMTSEVAMQPANAVSPSSEHPGTPTLELTPATTLMTTPITKTTTTMTTTTTTTTTVKMDKIRSEWQKLLQMFASKTSVDNLLVMGDIFKLYAQKESVRLADLVTHCFNQLRRAASKVRFEFDIARGTNGLPFTTDLDCKQRSKATKHCALDNTGTEAASTYPEMDAVLAETMVAAPSEAVLRRFKRWRTIVAKFGHGASPRLVK